MKTKDEVRDKTKEILLSAWEEQWKSAEGFDAENDVFYKAFVKAYNDVCKGAYRNNKRNFRWKKLFLLVLLVDPALRVIFFILSLLLEIAGRFIPLFLSVSDVMTDLFGRFFFTGKANNLVEYAASLLIWFLFAAVIAKWVDIKKYQETWVRHSNHQHKLEAEMMKFIYKLDIYETGPVREKFMKEIAKIWDENQKAFSDNMNNKEKPLNDITVSLKNFKESIK